MRKADMVARIAEKTGIPKVDVLVALETFFKEVKGSLADNEPVFVRGFGSFIIKKRAAKIGRNIKKITVCGALFLQTDISNRFQIEI